jgi:hypothetical protein
VQFLEALLNVLRILGVEPVTLLEVGVLDQVRDAIVHRELIQRDAPARAEGTRRRRDVSIAV